ncbi:hypothetical protein F3Y22_tig00110403pilonHSYRG00011 [Hibiscus syriacus]|uniref:Uncharacterized protein n=1 Tax=Hibiscus syriacus TaxID=106335 RepID=A0A6A3ANC1_HIBSY|nr:hypothetical protein F3Y22_tig00110403pilonHSYRG00011 [Hibiscus syriacus]
MNSSIEAPKRGEGSALSWAFMAFCIGFVSPSLLIIIYGKIISRVNQLVHKIYSESASVEPIRVAEAKGLEHFRSLLKEPKAMVALSQCNANHVLEFLHYSISSARLRCTYKVCSLGNRNRPGRAHARLDKLGVLDSHWSAPGRVRGEWRLLETNPFAAVL